MAEYTPLAGEVAILKPDKSRMPTNPQQYTPPSQTDSISLATTSKTPLSSDKRVVKYVKRLRGTVKFNPLKDAA